MKLPPITSGLFRVWQRDLDVFMKTWKTNFIPPILEPLLYIFAFGIGLGKLVSDIKYNGMVISYVEYIVPALISISIMYSAFFENTYASFVRMYYQKTFDAIIVTPISIEDVIGGEIIWGATKSLLNATIMIIVILPFGLINIPLSIFILPLSILGGLMFGAIAMIFTGIVPNIDSFNYPVFLFITPMFLFSGTFFPLDLLPEWARYVAMFLPLTHLVTIIRGLTLNSLTYNMIISLIYIIFSGVICFYLGIIIMRKKLIQ